MVAQSVSFLGGSLCFLIVGSVVRKVADWNTSYVHDFLIGLALSNAVFTFVSLGYPINNTIVFLFALAVTGLFLINFTFEQTYFRQLVDRFVRCFRENPVFFFVLLLCIVLSFFQSLYSPSLHYDSGLYHVPEIKWTTEHKTIRGLVHLNSFLGYNFNVFSLNAAFYQLFEQPVYPLNFTITCLFLLWLLSRINDSIKSDYYVLAAAYLLILYYLLVNFWPHISTPSNDTLVFVLNTIILMSGIDLKENRDVTFSIIILSVYAITVKLSSAPVLLLAIYFFFTTYYWRHTKQAVLTLLISGFILLPWLIKNVLLTGWLLFPFPQIDLFTFDWKLQVQEVVQLKESIRNFYVPNGDSRSRWLNVWLLNQSKVDLFIVVLSVVTHLTLVGQLVSKKVYLSNDHLMVVCVAIFGIAFMFMNSPSLRYGAAFFLVTIALSINVFTLKANGSQYGFYVVGILVLFTFFKDNWFHPWHFAKNITNRFLLPYPLVINEKKKFAYFLVDKKIKCYYPVGSNQCFDHLLPCASRRIDGIHLRGESIEQGFYRDAP